MDSTTRIPTGVFVLGTAASAVSATARAIGMLGVPGGEESDEASPPPSARRGGSFPDPGAVNRRVLRRLGGSPTAPPPLDSGWTGGPMLERSRRRARAAFLAGHQALQWVWGDPLLSLLLPFWTDALDVRPVAVVVHGQPLQASPSPGDAGRLQEPLARAVWERYARLALGNARGLPAVVMRAESLIDSPAEWARATAPFLEAQGLRLTTPAAPESLERLAAPLRTAPRTAAPEGDPPPSEAQRRLVAALDSLVGPHDALPAMTLPEETESTESLLRERRRRDRLAARRRRGRDARRAGRREPGRRGDEAPDAAATGREPGMLPHYLILGAQKAGTSSLYRYIAESPAVELPERKEVHYFDVQHHRGVEWYRSRFPPARDGSGRGTVTGEGSPYYLFHPLAPARVRELLPDARLLVLLRDPVRRAVSNYFHEVRAGRETLPLEAALAAEAERLEGEAERLVEEPGYESYNHRHFAYQARGVYVDQILAWRAVFPPEQLLVIQSERLFERPDREMRRVFEFLELPYAPPSPFRGTRAYPRPSREVEALLAARFAPDNARLYELLGEDLGW